VYICLMPLWHMMAFINPCQWECGVMML